MDGKYPFVHDDELVTRARAVIRNWSLRILPVVDRDRKVVGIISRGDIMKISSSVSLIRVRGVMTAPKYMATADADAFPTVKEMIRADEWYAPVVDSAASRKLDGVLGLEHFIDAIIKVSPEKLAKEVSEIMSQKVLTCSPDDEIGQVWRLMQERSLAGIPVVKNDRLVGMVTQKDFLESSSNYPTFESTKGRFRASPKISSIMHTGVISVRPSVKAIRVAKVMVSKDIGRIPVTDEEERLVGIVDREDIARMIVK